MIKLAVASTSTRGQHFLLHPDGRIENGVVLTKYG